MSSPESHTLAETQTHIAMLKTVLLGDKFYNPRLIARQYIVSKEFRFQRSLSITSKNTKFIKYNMAIVAKKSQLTSEPTTADSRITSARCPNPIESKKGGGNF